MEVEIKVEGIDALEHSALEETREPELRTK